MRRNLVPVFPGWSLAPALAGAKVLGGGAAGYGTAFSQVVVLGTQDGAVHLRSCAAGHLSVYRLRSRLRTGLIGGCRVRLRKLWCSLVRCR